MRLVLHEVGVLGRVLVEVLENGDRPVAERPEEELRGEIPLADLKEDPVATLDAQFGEQLPHHLRPDRQPPVGAADCEIEDMEARSVELVDHERDDGVPDFGDHPDAVPLPETTGEVLVQPGKLESLLLDRKHFGHVAADHPAQLNPESVGFRGRHVSSLHRVGGQGGGEP